MKINKLLKIIWGLSVIIEIIVFIGTNIILKDTYEVYNSTNYLALIIIEIINIIFVVLLFKKSDSKLVHVLYIIFIIITLFVPIYHNANTYIPAELGSELMGLAIKERYLNIYGINILKIIK